MKKSKPNRPQYAAKLASDIDVIEPVGDLDDLIEIIFGELSDEAAAQIAELLMQLALCFENTHFSQIRRHRQATQPTPTYNPNQLELFDPF